MDELARELALMIAALMGFGVRHLVAYLRRLRTRRVARDILESPSGTNDPLEATRQAVVHVESRRIRSDSIQVARSIQAAQVPPKVDPDGKP